MHVRAVRVVAFLTSGVETLGPSAVITPIRSASALDYDNSRSLRTAVEMGERRNVLITGATGKQGRAAIDSLLRGDSAASVDYRVLALTRNASSASARRLAETFGDRLTIVQGNLDDAARTRQIFVDAGAQGGIWGVFAVLAYPGLGVKDDREEKQGRVCCAPSLQLDRIDSPPQMLADLALEFRVQAFVYSSTIPAGLNDGDALDHSHKAKRRLELYCEELGPKGLQWM